MLDEKQQALVEQNYKLVFKILSDMRLIKDEDAVQVGMLWLCKAAKKYDNNRGKFSTFAYSYIYYGTLMHKKKCQNHQCLNIDDMMCESEVDPYEYLEDTNYSRGVKSKNNINFIKENTDMRTQKILELKLIGYNQGEIGKILNIDQPRVSRVLNKLKNNKEILNGIEW